MIIEYIRGVKDEFLKINWIRFGEVITSSMIVFLVIVFFSSVFLSFDMFSTKAVKLIFGIK